MSLESDRAPGYNPNSLDASLANLFLRMDIQDKSLVDIKADTKKQLEGGEMRFAALETWRREVELERKWFIGWLSCAISVVALLGSGLGIVCKIFLFPGH